MVNGLVFGKELPIGGHARCKITPEIMGWERDPSVAGVRTMDSAGELVWGFRPRTGDLANWSDDSLMAAVVARDPAALAVLYDRYSPLVYTTCLKVLGEPAVAEDVTQDVFLRLWQRPESFIPARGRFVTWLLSITRNRAVDEIRSRNRRRRRELSEPETLPVAPATTARDSDPASFAELREEQDSVRHALAQLPPEQRRVLELAFFGGYTHQEIAAFLREPLGTVKTRIRLGMQKLRTALAGLQ